MMYQEDEKRELDFWSRHFVNATRKRLVLNIKYRGKFCNKTAQTFSFSRKFSDQQSRTFLNSSAIFE